LVGTYGGIALRCSPALGLVESPALYGYMSGRDNLRAVGRVLGGVSESRIDEVLEVIHLRSRDRDRVNTYSLGMKQRLGLGLAMLNDPELYLLDKPANGLDPAGIAEIRDLLRELTAEGRTVFISSHVLGEIQQICDRVAIIQDGRLVTVSTVAELTDSGGEFVIILERPEAALALVRAQPWWPRSPYIPTGCNSASRRGKDRIANVARPNSVYQTINGLRRAGLIKVRETYREESRPERTVYEITEAGGQALQQWLLGMLSSTERVFADFPAALSFLPLLEPEAVLRQLEARARMLEERLAETDTSALELPRLFLIEEEYVRTVTQADLEWVRSVIDDLRTGRLTWSEEWLQGFAEMAGRDRPD